MTAKIVIGAALQGLQKNVIPSKVDNEAFPVLFNAYAWRGQIKRKRGTKLLGQLARQMQAAAVPLNWQVAVLGVIDGSGNLIVNTIVSKYSLSANSSIVAGSISITDGVHTWTDTLLTGTLSGTGGATGTINYATTALSLSGGTNGNNVVGFFSYYPTLPVMGLENFVMTDFQFPSLLAFDTKRSYQITTDAIPTFFSTSFYKGTGNPLVWSGDDYQQFWTTNYQGALWATNGVKGFHFVTSTYTAGTGTPAITFNFKTGGVNYTTLIVGDKLWFNEWAGGGVTINGLLGSVTTAADAVNGNYIVTFTGNQTVNGTGIAQLLTSSIDGQDGIKWYDGDPTTKTGLPAGTNLGWVNFAPPLTATTVSINNSAAKLWYLTGASAIVPFKDRLIFFGINIQSSDGTKVYLQDTVLWSWNGTAYYNSLVPTSQTGNTSAYYVDQVGFAGWISAGISQQIVSIVDNSDVLLVGFTGRQTRFVYTNNDLSPFEFYSISSEYGSGSTFSGISLGESAITMGIYGIVLTDQTHSERVDLQIPEQVFDFSQKNNANQRACSARDFKNEWIYFTYVPGNSNFIYPTGVLQYNYREQSWAIFSENYTTLGSYWQFTALTWAQLGKKYGIWDDWNDPWNTVQAEIQQVIGGTPQGFVVIKGLATREGDCASIKDITNPSGNITRITSPNHCLNSGEFILVNNSLGSTFLNGVICKVEYKTTDTFDIDVAFDPDAGPYIGLGTYSKLSQPLIQTKQFSPFMSQGRQTRLGVQRYLLQNSGLVPTDGNAITININLDQNPTTVWNSGSIVPTTIPTPKNNALIYSQTVFTGPEKNASDYYAAVDSQQIWHRCNTSLLGESIQIGFTLSEDQMKDTYSSQAEIILHGFILDVSPSGVLV